MQENSSRDPDYGLIAPISIPETERIPDEITGVATSAEYERYFRLVRRSMDLADWTRTCLSISQEITEDLERTNLGQEEKHDILAGLVTVQDVTLSRWLAAVSDSREATP